MVRVSTLLTGAILLIAPIAIDAQQSQVRPDQIQAFISPVDGSGVPVTDLKAEEIAMTENGAPGKVVSIDPFKLPIKLTLMVDNGNESATALASIRAGLTGLVEVLPADIEVTLITIAPQPAMYLRPTADRAQIMRAISRFGVDNDPPRFTDALVEYAERLEKEFKDKKLTYAPTLVMVSTTAQEASTSQRDTVEKALKSLAARGAKVSLAITTTKPTNNDSVDALKNGRQALIARPIITQSRGKFESMVAFNQMAMLLPEWGREIALAHTRQINQYRVVIDRPGGATGPLNRPGLKLTRPGLDGSVSFDGKFSQ